MKDEDEDEDNHQAAVLDCTFCGWKSNLSIYMLGNWQNILAIRVILWFVALLNICLVLVLSDFCGTGNAFMCANHGLMPYVVCMSVRVYLRQPWPNNVSVSDCFLSDGFSHSYKTKGGNCLLLQYELHLLFFSLI